MPATGSEVPGDPQLGYFCMFGNEPRNKRCSRDRFETVELHPFVLHKRNSLQLISEPARNYLVGKL